VARRGRHGAGCALGSLTIRYWERALREERAAILETMAGLDEVDFERGTTLCAGWAPRDVLAHLVGIDLHRDEYARAFGHVNRANARIVARLRTLDRTDLVALADRWAAVPVLTSRVGAVGLLGDHAVHHQDILRGLGRNRVVPEASAAAILREGVILGGRRLLTHRVEPTDGGRPLGRGRRVRGTREQLGMWLAGRRGIDRELDFG
jgi:uncharacterized protein (TIGR03083 family)